jgi:hypothetical protein
MNITFNKMSFAHLKRSDFELGRVDEFNQA